jgi:Arc/MetJ family transcription regulator
MRTNVELDDALVAEAMRISGINTKKIVLNMVLREYIRGNNLRNIRRSNIWEGNLEEMRTMR